MAAPEPMKKLPRNPQLYEINTRVWLNTLSRENGRRITLGKVPREKWSRFKDVGMDLVWLMGVWLPSPQGLEIARNHPGLIQSYREALPDFSPDDVVGSPYAVAGYTLNPALGEESELIQVREDLHRAGLGLILDFVPNHTSRDHPWVANHPERYVGAGSADWFGAGDAFSNRCTGGETRWIAHGRDPYFPPWTDTAQIRALSPETRKAVSEELSRLAEMCDGLRCDMAMLLLNRVFQQTWGWWLERAAEPSPATEYWTDVLKPLRETNPDFLLIAEAYWGLEKDLLELGFDYAYDKARYDSLRSLDAPAYKHLLAEEGARTSKMLRFLENHDEDRMARVFPSQTIHSAAVIHATAPGLRFFHHGQLEGKKVKLPVQLKREPDEPIDEGIASFYRRLLAQTSGPLFKEGIGHVLIVEPAFSGDEGHRPVVAFGYEYEELRGVVAVNYSGQTASGYLRFPENFWRGWNQVRLLDVLKQPEDVYDREEDDLQSRGLYVKLEPFRFHFLIASR